MTKWVLVLVCGLLACAVPRINAETVILKDGTFVEGKVVRKTSRMVRVETRFGPRSILKRDIDQIIATIDPADVDASHFDELTPALQAVLNAQADYKLKKYDRALARIEPFLADTSNRAVAMKIDWMHIEILERLGRWDQVKELLNDKVETGTPREKTRAQAHLDIFEANPAFDLRFVGKRHARNFLISPSLRERARNAGSLRDAAVMRAALEEYCEQLLVKDKLSVKAFADLLDPQKTYEALTRPRRGSIEKRLPYTKDLQKAEASLYKAQSVLGDYGAAFELDLIRTEMVHLLDVGNRLLNELLEANPGLYQPPVNPSTGRWTAEGRREWRRRCDDFIAKARPLQALLNYMKEKTERYPRDLKRLYDIVKDFEERIGQNVRSVKRDRNRSHD